MMNKIEIAPGLSFSRIAWGFWRLAEWELSSSKLLRRLEMALDLGISTFDHADIYGDYSCESLFGQALRQAPDLRQQMQLVSKCGIKLVSEKYPNRRTKQYDSRAGHIIASVEQSLVNLRTDYLDVLLLHRPDPLMQPEEVAHAFEQLRQSGKVRYFGVSNFSPSQFSLLQAYLPEKLVTNQIEFSPYYVTPLQDGSLDFLMQERIVPMIWSPLAGGCIFQPEDPKGARLRASLEELSRELQIGPIDTLIYAWLLKHPTNPIPLVGSGRAERLQHAAQALSVDLPHEAWYRIYEASLGHEIA